SFSSPIPWRITGLRYNTNDIYFYTIKTLDTVVNKNGAIITSSVLSKIDLNCKLSGVLHVIIDPSLYPYMRLNRFAQSQALSFIPPDGRFTLMEYRFDPSANKPGTAPALTVAAAAQVQAQVPFTLCASLSITDHGGAFELIFTLCAGALKDVAAELYHSTGAMGPTSTGATGGGEWMYVPVRGTLRWSLASSATSSSTSRSVSAPARTTTLRCTFASSDSHLRAACAALILFALPAPLSVLKIDQLKPSAETYKPYKGMRGWALGRVEWRVEWKGG
ncbi:Mu homology domain containing protein, partial [Lactarius tabidus]